MQLYMCAGRYIGSNSGALDCASVQSAVFIGITTAYGQDIVTCHQTTRVVHFLQCDGDVRMNQPRYHCVISTSRMPAQPGTPMPSGWMTDAVMYQSFAHKHIAIIEQPGIACMSSIWRGIQCWHLPHHSFLVFEATCMYHTCSMDINT
jgi:hypothetical protein